MAQTRQLIDTLKQALKSHGLSYSDVAKTLDLSEASVKRLFSECSFSLLRLDSICQMMPMEISDLIVMMNQRNSEAMLSSLSWQQEQDIADDTALLLVAVCVLNRWSTDELLEHYHLTEAQCIRYLIRLERLKLIELLPKNKIKLKISANFKWLEDGPIQQFFQQNLAADFLSGGFKRSHERLIVINGMLSDQAMAVFHRKLQQLAREFDELNTEDAALSLDQRHGSTVMLAMRDWQYGLFEQFRRQ
jgi:DNA-binding Xre family transcriptional regulator